MGKTKKRWKERKKAGRMEKRDKNRVGKKAREIW